MVVEVPWHNETNEDMFSKSLVIIMEEHYTVREFFIFPVSGVEIRSTATIMSNITAAGVSVVSCNIHRKDDKKGVLLEVKLNAEWIKTHRLDDLTEKAASEFLQGFINFPWLKMWPVTCLDNYPMDDGYFSVFSDQVHGKIKQQMQCPNGQQYLLVRDEANMYKVLEQARQ